jgi:hypothetical protein
LAAVRNTGTASVVQRPLSHPVIPRSWRESQRIGFPGKHRIVSSVILQTDDSRQATPRAWHKRRCPEEVEMGYFTHDSEQGT